MRLMPIAIALMIAFPATAQQQPTAPGGNGGATRPGGGGGMTRPGGDMARPVRPDRPQIQPPRPGTGGPQIQPPRPGRPDVVRPPRPTHPRPPYHGHRPGHRPPFHYPHGYHYRRWHRGLILPTVFLTTHYYFHSYGAYGLPHPPFGFRWVHYGPDVLLVDTRTGRIRDVRYGMLD